jgi:hypothetical protein
MSDSGYTPSTSLIREAYVSGAAFLSDEMVTPEMGARFDRWLAALTAQVRAEQIETDAQIAEARYFGGGVIGSANRWGAKQAAAAIREAGKRRAPHPTNNETEVKR